MNSDVLTGQNYSGGGCGKIGRREEMGTSRPPEGKFYMAKATQNMVTAQAIMTVNTQNVKNAPIHKYFN